MTDLGGRKYYKTALVTCGNFLYPTGTYVAVEYAGMDNRQAAHYYFVSGQDHRPSVLFNECNLTDFVL